ncbi:centrosomal protein, partial [Trichonephila inaurata madagascariensis]
MDDGTSVIDSNNFAIDIPHSEVGLEAVVALADQETLAKEIDNDLRNAFDGICDGDESEPEDESLTDHDLETESDDGDTDLNSNRYFTSEQYESSVAVSSADPNLQQRNESDVLESDIEHENKQRTDDSYEAFDHSYENSIHKQYHYVHKSQTSEEYGRSSVTEHSNHNLAKQTYHKDNNSGVYSVTDHGDYKNAKSSNPTISSASDSAVDLHGEYRKLCILYESTCQEMKQLKTEEIIYRKETEQTIKSLRLRLDLLESEKNELTSSLQESQNLMSGYMQEKNQLLGEVVGLESQLSSMTKVKEEIQAKLESSNVTIQMLERQLNELNRSGNMSRLRDHHNAILEEMKLRYEKDSLKFKESIDQIQSKLNSKVKEAEELILRNSELQQKYQKLQIEKAEWVNKMSQELEISQKKCQQYLESGTIEEVNRLKLQVQRMEEEKSNIERENSILRNEIKSLKTELETSEALQRMAFSNKKLHETLDGRGNELNLQKELEHSLKNVRSLRTEKDALKKQLNDSESKMKNLYKKADLLESQYAEAKKKIKELEDKVNSLSSNESASTAFYEKKIKSFENELSDLKINLHDVTEKLKLASANEKMLLENNEELQKKMTHLVQKHAEDKIQAVERCREQLLELHENALRKEKERIQAKASAELKDVCFKYENKISELQKEIKILNDGLYDSKNQFLVLYKENQNLLAKFDGILKPKEKEDIEKEIRLEYEQKLNEMKIVLTKQNQEYLANCLKNEVEKVQMEWTKQKVEEIKDFVESTKQKLNDEFQNCLQKDQAELQKQLQTEKEKLLQEYAKKVKDINKLYEEERDKLSTKLNQDLQSKWEKELAMLKERHENEVKFMQHEFENKLQKMENEMKDLKEKNFAKSSENEMLKLKQDFILEQEKWQKEKEALACTESALNENLKLLRESEKKLLGKVKKYEQHTAAVKKHYQEKVANLQSELTNFQRSSNEKQNELQKIKEKYEQEILELKSKFRKQN